MSEAEDDWVEPLALVAGVLVALVGVANYVGTDCTALFGKIYDGAIIVGDSLTLVGLVGGVVAFAANRFVDSRRRRSTQRRRPQSEPSRRGEDRGRSGRSLTLSAMKWFAGLLLLGAVVTLAGWWLANTSDIQCASGFWSGFLSGRIPP